MSMKAMNDIREMLCDELDEVSRHGTLNVRDLDVVYKVTQSIANLDDIMEEEGYSHDGGWEAKMRGSYGNDMRRDRRYADDMRRRMDTDQDDREYKRRYAEDTKNVNTYYFAEIAVDADHDGNIYECRKRGFESLESNPDFLQNTVRKGSYGEDWSLRKVLRRFIWHDRIHARAMYRMAIKVFGAESIVNPFYFFDEGVLT